MTRTAIFLSGQFNDDIHIDLGLDVDGLSLAGREFTVRGSSASESFFLRPAGYSFEFTHNASNTDTIYLTGNYEDYTVETVRGENSAGITMDMVKLRRGEGDTSEFVTVTAQGGSTMSLVFANGWVSAGEVYNNQGNVTLSTTETSINPDLPETTTGEVRVGASGGPLDQANLFGLNGPTFRAFGNGGVDQVYVAAGSKVQATDLGVGKDEIFLEGRWEDYTKEYVKSHLTLKRPVVNALTGEQYTEEVTVIGGLGANNDLLIFSDGAVDTRAALLAVRAAEDAGLNPDTNPAAITATDIDTWDGDRTSFSSKVSLEAQADGDNFQLVADSGPSATDLITNDGQVTVLGLREGYAWQYKVGDGPWMQGTTTPEGEAVFTLDAQASGADGAVYEAGQVQVRQVNPFGVAGDAVSNKQDIIVDDVAAESRYSPPVTGLLTGQTSASRARVRTPFTQQEGVTVQFWFYIDDANDTQNRLLIGRNLATRINANSDGQISYYLEGDSTYNDFDGVTAAAGWNYLSISTNGADGATATIFNDKWPDGATGSTTGRVTDDNTALDLILGTTSGGDFPLGGVIRDVSIWTGARTLQQVGEDRTAERTGQEAGLQGHWRFDEGPGETAPANLTGSTTNTAFLVGNATTGVSAPGYFPGYNAASVPSSPLIVGQDAEPHSQITISYDGPGGNGVAGTTTADGSGNWRFEFTQTLADGDYTITVDVEDRAGNPASSQMTITVDGSIPSAPELDAGSDSGTQGDNITNNTTPTISGTLPDGVDPATVVVMINGESKSTGDTNPELTVTGNSWEFTPASPLEPGEHTIVVSVGGAMSAPLVLTIDSAALHVTVDGPFFSAMETNNQATGDGGGASLDYSFSTATVGGWVYIDNPQASGEQLILHTGGDMTLRLIGGDLQVFADGGYVATGFEITQGWHYIAVTDDPDQVVVHFNDEKVSTGRTSSASRSYMQFGRHNDGDERAFFGAFRDVQFWERALSDQEIRDARNGAVNLDDPSLVGYWALDHSSSGGQNSVRGGPDLTVSSPATIGVWEAAAVQDTLFRNGEMTVTGKLAPDITSLTVTWNDGAQTAVANAEIDTVNGLWTAAFTTADMTALTEGASLTLQLRAEDAAGNVHEVDYANAAGLEMQNLAPEVNAAVEIAAQGVSFGAAGADIIDLAAIQAFTDADAAGSLNATLKYSATLSDDSPLPDWLEMTDDGVLRVVDGMTADVIEGGSLELKVTVQDRDGAVDGLSSESRTFTLFMPVKPDLQPGSDSGADDDDVTNVTTPVIEGTLPVHAQAGTEIKILINGQEVAAGSTEGSQGNGLEIFYTTNSWRYTPAEPLEPGDYEVAVAVGDVESVPLMVTIDDIAAPVILDTQFFSGMATNNTDSSGRGGARIDHAFGAQATIGAWVYVANPDGAGMDDAQLIFHTFRDMSVQIENGTLYVYGGSDWHPAKTGAEGRETDLTLKHGWNYIAVTDDSNNVFIHVNGEKSNALPSRATQPTYVNFGRHNSSEERAFDGAFRDVQIWDRALSDEEIENARNGGDYDVTDATLVGHWALDSSNGFENAKQDGDPLQQAGEAEIKQGFIEASSIIDDPLQGRVFEFGGTLPADITSLTVTLDDSDTTVSNDLSVPAHIDEESGRWRAVFTETQLQNLADGDLTVTLTARDAADNETQTVFDKMTILEMTNQNPRSNDGQDIIGLIVGRGVTGAPGVDGEEGGTLIVDLTDINGDGAASVDDTAFADDDAAGSANAALTYELTDLEGVQPPAWLTITQQGVLKIAEGASVPDDFNGVTVRVKATDGGGGEGFRDVMISAALGLTSSMHDVEQLDVRSDVVIESLVDGDNIAFNLAAEEGTVYEIELIEIEDSIKSGFRGEEGLDRRTITVTITGGQAQISGPGSIEIVNGKAVINFDQDLDLSNKYQVVVEEGLFVSETSGLASDAVLPGQIEFSTVTPGSASGEVSKIWEGDALVDGAQWYDGTGGSHVNNQTGMSADFSDHAAVLVVGRDTTPDSDATVLSTGGRSRIVGFGGDDFIYVDRGAGDVANTFNIFTVPVDDGRVEQDGATPVSWTTVSFSTDVLDGPGSEETVQAGVLIRFADREGDPRGLTESALTATTYLHADAGAGEESFESLTGNAQPVIGG